MADIYTILIVDDIVANRAILHDHVIALGYIPILAENGVEALVQIRNRQPDLVLLDIEMPVMDGFRVLKTLKADSHLRHIPVIIISGLDDMNGIMECIRLGADDYLTKPFNPEFLNARIHGSLQRLSVLREEQQQRAHLDSYVLKLTESKQSEALYSKSHVAQPAVESGSKSQDSARIVPTNAQTTLALASDQMVTPTDGRGTATEHSSSPQAPFVWVHKRDGRVVPFQTDKIRRSVLAASDESLDDPDGFAIQELTDIIVRSLVAETHGTTPTTAQIAQVVVTVVRELGLGGLAQAFERGRRDAVSAGRSFKSREAKSIGFAFSFRKQLAVACVAIVSLLIVGFICLFYSIMIDPSRVAMQHISNYPPPYEKPDRRDHRSGVRTEDSSNQPGPMLRLKGVPFAPSGNATAYCLAVGVSKYQDSSLNLDLAEKDATHIANALKMQEGQGCFEKVSPTLLVNEEATRDNILVQLKRFSALAKNRDLVFVIFCGHGDVDNQNKFYFLPHDFDKSENNPRLKGIFWEDLKYYLGRLDCHVVVVTDACNSGRLTTELARGVRDRTLETSITKAVEQFAETENGMVILSASFSREDAVERPEWGHGAFTLALLEGLEGHVIYGKSAHTMLLSGEKDTGMFSLDDLRLYAARRVKELTNDRQHVIHNNSKNVSLQAVPIALRQDIRITNRNATTDKSSE